ncbi:MAG TPA: RHS repeat-associated core domain-containing protein [Thermoanaerobaculia bacterium]|nr:RHS repeat-associated core domain-containing protein [Thermoanaerobaculia bacterium]
MNIVLLRLLVMLIAFVPCSLRAEDAPRSVPQAVKALEYLKAQPNTGPTSWTNGPYVYDGAGNVTAIGTEVYVYDKVGRLRTATVRGPVMDAMQTQSFTYDEYANLTSITKLGETVHLDVTAGTNRLSNVEYDGAGNVITANTQHYEYDAMGMLSTVRLGTSTQPRMIYAYTADDERLFAFDVSSNTTHWTVRGLDNKVLRDFKQHGNAWSVERDYVYRDGLLLAALRPGGLVEHYSLDHLRTPRLVTDGAGNKIGYHVYWPFGEEWSPGNTQEGSPLRFTGHERDEDPSGGNAPLDNMHARMYSSRWGRFLSVDPSLNTNSALREPQGWNRYAYVFGNPLKSVDLDGRDRYQEPGFTKKMTPENLCCAPPAVSWALRSGAAALSIATVEILGAGELVSIGLGANRLQRTLENEAAPSSVPSTRIYTPKDADGNPLPLPRDAHGNEMPDPAAAGRPHTQLGSRTTPTKGEAPYSQVREWNGNAQGGRRIDFSNHNEPAVHPNPHQHVIQPNGKVGPPEPVPEFQPKP